MSILTKFEHLKLTLNGNDDTVDKSKKSIEKMFLTF